MTEVKKRINLRKIQRYLRDKRDAILEEMNVISYVTKPEFADDQVDPRVVAFTDPKSHISEQYRSIRTNITSLSPESPIRSFLLTSSLRGEGKTITASNLAMVFSQDIEKKTVLVDADLRKPNLHKIFKLEKEPGLAEILAGRAGVEDFLKSPNVGNLYVIPGGKSPASPSEMIGSKNMRALIQKLQDQFDWVIFDVAPIMAVTDAGVLGTLLDGSIMIVKAGKTQAVDVERAYSLLLEANAKPFASILTGVMTYIPYYLYRYRYIYSQQYYGG